MSEGNDLAIRLLKALIEANSFSRSAGHVARRHGLGTNWEAFEAMSSKSLIKQHETIMSIGKELGIENPYMELWQVDKKGGAR